MSSTSDTANNNGQSTSIFGKVLDWPHENQTLASGALTVGGKFLEGAFSTVDPARVAAFQAQAAANNAAAALTALQTKNLSMPKAVASSSPITGAPGPIIPPSGQVGGLGIINSTPRLAQVTGVPA
jgi:hypothetical protein